MAKRYDITTLGEIMLRLSPPHNDRLLQTSSLDMKFGGAETNIAVNLARLGYKSAWLSRLPDNVFGQRVLSELSGFGVDTSGVRLAAGERIGTYFIEFGAPPRPNRVVYDRANSAASKMRVSDVAFDVIADSAWFHTTGITSALSANCEEMTLATVLFARERGLRVSFDVNYRALLWSPAEAARVLEPILKLCHIAFVAHRDAIALFGVSEDTNTAAKELQARFGNEILVMTVGENGAVAATASEVLHVEQPFSVPHPVDRIGAGDAFDAGFIASQMRSASLEDSMRFGHAMSALKMTIPGDYALVTLPEVEMLLGGERRASVR
jgi:2-dehydro-3-deoxygluconokinase